jgi:hypothetical protein
MKKILIVSLLVFLFAVPCFAGEQVDLAVPETCTNYRVANLFLDWDGQMITVCLRCAATGKVLTFTYSGTEARNMMIVLNKANLSSNSLHKRILDKLITDGKIAGSVSGAPD